jgi:phenylacetate-CoA ligase
MADEALSRPGAIQAEQSARLGRLVGAVLSGNGFYRSKLAAAGITAPPRTIAEFTARFPCTTKQELAEDQRNHPPYGTNLTFPIERYTRFHQTSGTGGAPLRWLDTPESWEWMLGNWGEIYAKAGVERRDHVFFAFSFGPFIGFWLAFEAAARLGCLCLPGGGLGSAARLRMLLDNGATVLCCTPTYAIRLAEVAAAENIDLAASKVRTILVAGEPGGGIPSTRRRIESLWRGARVFDHHGMTEVGPVSYECPAQPGRLHILASRYLAEIINPETSAAATCGERGELVLTPLGREGSPLLRYRTGDLVRAAKDARIEDGVLLTDRCQCGSHDLALDGGILGRVDDMVVVRGVNVYPGAVEEIVRATGGVAEYRVLVGDGGAMTELKIEVEPETEGGPVESLRERLQKAFQTALSLRIAVEVVSPGTLPRYEMKARRWVRA